MYILQKNGPKIKKQIFPLMTTFYSLLLRSLSSFWKLEVSVMLLCMFGLFVSEYKKFKICNVKKNTSKRTKFTIKS